MSVTVSFRKAALSLGVVAIVLGIAAVAYKPVQAAGPYFGRNHGERYYTGVATNQSYGRYMFEDGVPRDWQTANTTVDDFINDVVFYLNDPANTNDDNVRASILINTMMGQNGDSTQFAGPTATRWQNGVLAARTAESRWEAIVRAYDAKSIPGASVEWNKTIFYAVWTDDELGDGGTTGPGNEYPDAFNTQVPPSTEASIQFHNPDGTTYTISKKCGNLTGTESPLAQSGDFNYLPSAQPSGGSPAFGGTITSANTSISLDGIVRNAGLLAGQTGTYWIVANQPVGAGGFVTSQSSTTVSSPASVPALAAGASQTVVTGVKFTLDWSKTLPSQLCFTAYVSPPNSTTTQAASSSQYCYAINNAVSGPEPYFTVESGDFAAGPGFGAGCTTVKSDVTAYNLGASNKYFGSSSQLATLATGAIDGFATDNTNNLSTTMGGGTNGLTAVTGGSPMALAFGNSVSGGGEYGGGYDRSGWCVPDYYTSAAAAATGTYSSVTSGTYTLSGGSTIALPTIPAGVHLTLVVNGDAYISQNVTYGAYSAVGDIPQFTLVVKGNLYVNSAVTQLRGLYVAQAGGGTNGGGVVYTCATGIAAPSTDATVCNHQLIVYGSMMAVKLMLGRTYGDLKPTGGVTNNPAERFVYTPEVWLGGSTGASCSDSGSSGSCPYQSFTGLPPVL